MSLKSARIGMAVLLVQLFATTVALNAQSVPLKKDENAAFNPCTNGKAAPIKILETRASARVEEDLSLVDGINVNRDVIVVACREQLFLQHRNAKDDTVIVQVRAWQKPKDGGWREIRINEPSVLQARNYGYDGTSPTNWRVEEVNAVVRKDSSIDPIITIPLRRDAAKPEDLIRIRVQVSEGPIPTSAPVPPDSNSNADANPNAPRAIVSENEQVIDTVFEVGRFGLHVGFSDLVVFVQRLGEDRANNRGDKDVLFDVVNFRPAPGVSYGFNFYDRRHALLRFLEPGFGAHLVFLNWNDRSKLAPADNTQVTALQLGVGTMGSMFDGTVVAVIGANLHVKDYRPYFGVGFSITGLVRKLSRFLR